MACINIHADNPGYGGSTAAIDGGRIAHTKYGNVFSQCLDDTIALLCRVLLKTYMVVNLLK